MSSGPSGSTVSLLDVVTLLIALGGLITAVISLVWQVALHRSSGSVVRVELLAGALGHGGVLTGPLSQFDAHDLTSQGYDHPLLAVRARNVGRLAVDVTGWDIAIADGFGFSLPGSPMNPGLPHRLEPGSVATFLCDREYVEGIVEIKAESGLPSRSIRGQVTLGTGETVQSKAQDLPRLP